MSSVKKEKAQKRSWFVGLKAEYKKIIWPKKSTIIKESTAVIIVSVLLGTIISIVDLVIKYGVNFIVK